MTAHRLPLTRGDCADGPRPCPHACRHRLEGAESCALDVADRGGITRDEIGALLGMTRVAVAQAEKRAVRRLCARLGVPVPAVEEYSLTDVSDVPHPSTVTGEANEALVLAALVRITSGTTPDVAAATGKSYDVTYSILIRLVESGRAIRRRLPGRAGFYVYTPAMSEAAE